MSDETTLYLICGGILFLVVLFMLIRRLIGTYNQLQKIKNHVREANSNVMVMLQKKAELVNQLVNIAGAYAQHEQFVHLGVAHNVNMANAVDAYQDINQTIQRVYAIAASFPELKANQTFQQLMQQLQGVEDQLQLKREEYNHNVLTYNGVRNRFPMMIFASMLGQNELPFFADVQGDPNQMRAAHSGGAALPIPPAQPMVAPPKTRTPMLMTGSANLIGLSGEAAGRTYSIVDGYTIGRSSSCQLRLRDTSVSRQHARLRYANNRWFIQDQNSSGGTFVNGHPVSARELNIGDIVRIGSTEMEFRN